MIDLRHGVRDEFTDDHTTLGLYLEELRRCQRTSLGPSFILLGGQKYGFRPLPKVITVSKFEAILRVLTEVRQDQDILLKW